MISPLDNLPSETNLNIYHQIVRNQTNPNTLLGDDGGNPSIEGLKNQEKLNIFNISRTQIPEVEPPRKRSILGEASTALLEGVKRAALTETQRRLNIQFTLLNDTLDRIRNTYGIGRIPEPTNVYNYTPGGQFFFDVKNSLRNFAGDILSGYILGQ